MANYYSGDYAANNAQYLDAWNKAKAAIAAQRQRTLQGYGYGAGGQLDPTNKYGQYQQIEHNYGFGKQNLQHDKDFFNTQNALGVSRENEDYATQLAQAQKQSGFKFNNGGLELSDDPTGEYQRLMGGQTRNLTSLEDAQVSRGLGGKGLGGRALHQAEGDFGARRSNYRDQLLNILTGNARNHERSLADFASQLAEGNYGFDQQGGEADWQRGVAQQQLGFDLTDAMSGFDQQGFGVDAQYAGNKNDAMLQAILAALGNDTGIGGSRTKPTPYNYTGARVNRAEGW